MSHMSFGFLMPSHFGLEWHLMTCRLGSSDDATSQVGLDLLMMLQMSLDHWIIWLATLGLLMTSQKGWTLGWYHRWVCTFKWCHKPDNVTCEFRTSGDITAGFGQFGPSNDATHGFGITKNINALLTDRLFPDRVGPCNTLFYDDVMWWWWPSKMSH